VKDLKAELVKLYQQMSEMTLPECQGKDGPTKSCSLPLSCCQSMYCWMTKEHAKDRWGVELPITSHPTLPLMGPNGCTAAPHLRPICTVHTCKINALGFKPGDPEWTEKYFALRESIELTEWEIFG
jgi:hypothetical protein